MAFQLLASGPKVAYTYGWDTVSAVRVSDMNRAIREAGASPRSFTSAIEGVDADLAADFGDWQIDSGGDGRLIHLAMPLRNLRARYQQQTWVGSATARVEVQLQLLPHTLLRAGGVSQRHQLVVRTGGGDQGPRAAGLMRAVPALGDLPIANVIDLDEFAPGDPGGYFRVLIKMGLKDWLCEHLSEFGHVFATVNVYSATSREEAFHWLKPTYATYAFLAHPDLDDSVFGILCRTGNRSPDTLIEQISPYAIPDGATTGFMLSPERMLTDMMAPSLPLILKGLSARDISVDESQLQLTVSKTVQLDEFDYKGKTYTPKLEKLLVELRDRELIMTSTTSTTVAPGIESVSESQTFYNIGLAIREDGTKTLGYRESRTPIKRDWTRKSEAVKVTEIILSIASAIAGIVVLVFSLGAAAPVVLLIGALLLGGLITIKVIEAVHEGDAPALDLLVNNATDSITWANGSVFNLTSAELNGSLQMGGYFTGTVTKL